MDVPHYWTAGQVKRLLDALAAHNRHQARTAALIMWRTGLRVSEVLELEWRDLDYVGDPATLLVRRSKSRRARTVRLHPDLVQLFTNWPASRAARDKVVALSMRTALRHIGDGIEWAGLGEESPGTRAATCWRSQSEAQCCPALAHGGEGSAECGVGMAGTCQRPGHSADLPAYCGQRLRDGGRAVGFRLAVSLWSGCRRPDFFVVRWLRC